jgi:hypothetical protein
MPTLEMVGFGGFCGETHSNFHVKKHPTYMSLTGYDLIFSLKIHINFSFLTNFFGKIKISLYSNISISQNIP